MLEVDDVTVRFDTTTALDGVSLRLGQGERLAVLGPSGSGKSTLLRAIGGLEPLAGGSVSWDGQDLAGVPPHRRRFGFMFQGYALFPHLTVQENVAFGLRMEDRPRTDIAVRTDEVLSWVGMEQFADRTVDGLSGGEQQRVALARTLAPAPLLVMLDEPLGALDRALRDRLLPEMTAVIAEADIPALYVTHDHDEAAAFAERIALLREGSVVQTGTLPEIRRSPADDWVAGFVR